MLRAFYRAGACLGISCGAALTDVPQAGPSSQALGHLCPKFFLEKECKPEPSAHFKS